MWRWLKSNIFQPVADFFSGIATSVRNFFADQPQYQLIPSDIHHRDETLAQPIQGQAESALVEKRQPTDTSNPYNFMFSEPATEILPMVEAKPLVNLASVCKHFQNLSFFQMLLSIAKAAHSVVVKPSVVEVTKMLDTLDVESLKAFLKRKVGKVEDQSDRTIRNSTLFQLARGAEDDEMCCDVLPFYFERAFGSKEAAREEMCRQLDEKFPEQSKEEKEALDLPIKNQLAALLTAVIQAISVETFNNGKDKKGRWILSKATLQAIETYRVGFDALHPKIIDEGPHYRSQSTQEVLNAYAQAAQQWGYDYKKCALFEDGVLVKALEKEPGNNGQRFSQGLYHLLKANPDAFARSLKTTDGEHFYTYLRNESVDFAGLLGSCIDIVFGRSDAQHTGVLGRARAALAQISCQTKTERLATLRSECVSAQTKLGY